MSDKLAGYEKYFRVPKEEICEVYDITQRKDGMWVVGYKLTKYYKDKKAGLKHIFTRRDREAAVALHNYLYSSMMVSEREKKKFKSNITKELNDLKDGLREARKKTKEKYRLALEKSIEDLKKGFDDKLIEYQILVDNKKVSFKTFKKMRQTAIKYLKENDTVELQKRNSKRF